MLQKRCIALLACLLASSTGFAGSKEDALQAATGGCTFTRKALFFSPQEQARIAQASGGSFARKHLGQYQGSCADGTVYGYFTSGRVRTKNQALMVLVQPTGEIMQVKVVHFQEPPEYKAPERWYTMFTGQQLSADLRPGRNIQALTGATLTVRATTEMVREVLAVHQVMVPE